VSRAQSYWLVSAAAAAAAQRRDRCGVMEAEGEMQRCEMRRTPSHRLPLLIVVVDLKRARGDRLIALSPVNTEPHHPLHRRSPPVIPIYTVQLVTSK